MIEEVNIINFRSLNSLKFKIGKNLTLISGTNGIGKSTVLGIIASCSGTKSFKSLTDKSMYPDFTDYFILDKSEHKEGNDKYKVVTKYSMDSIKDDKSTEVFKFITTSHPNSPRIKIVPRTSDAEGVQKLEVQDSIAKITGITKDQVIPLPTEYLSSSRILPFGETTIDQKVNSIVRIKKRKNIPNPGDVAAKYVEYYNKILPGSFPNPSSSYQYELFEVKKPELKGDSYLIVKPKHFEIPAMSLGQDSVSKIVNSLLNFYALSKEPDYKGGILLVDELDLSLHPDAQVRLLKLLKKCSEDLNLQIIFTTHSLTLIKEMKKYEHTSKNDKFKVAYLRGKHKTKVTYDDTYDLIKKDLFQTVQPNISPKTKIYFEDNEAKILLEELLSYSFEKEYLSSEDHSKIIGNIEMIPSLIGSDTLAKLPFIDSYFKNVIIILDGDARYTRKLSNQDFLSNEAISNVLQSNEVKHFFNTLFLPCFPSPEQFVFKSLKEMCDYSESHESFWDNALHTEGMNFYLETIGPMLEEMIESNQTDRDSLKKWFKEYLSTFYDVGLFSYIFSKFIQEKDIKLFIKEFHSKVNNQINIKIAKRF